ncbi:MAG: ABC transporter permease, partial [Candidatus Aenigmarchaeota archaeon]|nr:ABC transporter permease [Candidatus Aenigmarchaeota archaeon]MDW8149592.1 ABC transporter permease [Candidatus Aenigmarchaeota archaeon]
GGLIGIFCGFIIAGIISESGFVVRGVAGRITIVEVKITPQLILFALLFSFFVGVIAGILPARKAASLQPVEALRYE